MLRQEEGEPGHLGCVLSLGKPLISHASSGTSQNGTSTDLLDMVLARRSVVSAWDGAFLMDNAALWEVLVCY